MCQKLTVAPLISLAWPCQLPLPFEPHQFAIMKCHANFANITAFLCLTCSAFLYVHYSWQSAWYVIANWFLLFTHLLSVIAWEVVWTLETFKREKLMQGWTRQSEMAKHLGLSSITSTFALYNQEYSPPSGSNSRNMMERCAQSYFIRINLVRSVQSS